MVEIHARSSVHAIDGRAMEVRGDVDVETDGDDVAAVISGHIEVPVAQLRSGNPLYDAELQRRVDARRFPTIVGEVRKATPLADGRFDVDGELTFHGVTRIVAGQVRVVVEDDRLRIEGEQVFDVRDFGIKPPRILMLRVEPDVRVHISLVAELS